MKNLDGKVAIVTLQCWLSPHPAPLLDWLWIRWHILRTLVSIPALLSDLLSVLLADR